MESALENLFIEIEVGDLFLFLGNNISCCLGTLCPGGYLYTTLYVKERKADDASFLGEMGQ